jgi:dipeptidyl aminopeptidase/acylaminoacyl peptidase
VQNDDAPVEARILNVDTGRVKVLPNTYGINLGCTVWSPDGARLACSSSYTEGSPETAGIYTVRASDGRGIRTVTSIPGGEDEPGSYSPNGERLEFVRVLNDSAVGLFVVKLNGTGLTRITPPGASIDGDRFGDWSPRGNNIMFAQHGNADLRNSIWIVHADGRRLARSTSTAPSSAAAPLRSRFPPGASTPPGHRTARRSHSSSTNPAVTVRASTPPTPTAHTCGDSPTRSPSTRTGARIRLRAAGERDQLEQCGQRGMFDYW